MFALLFKDVRMFYCCFFSEETSSIHYEQIFDNFRLVIFKFYILLLCQHYAALGSCQVPRNMLVLLGTEE